MIKHKDLLTEKQQKRLYLVHHMHHYQDGKDTTHEMHHCFLFSKKKMKGEKFTIDHLLINKKLHHIIAGQPPEVLFDHASNEFVVKEIKSKGKNYYIFK